MGKKYWESHGNLSGNVGTMKFCSLAREARIQTNFMDFAYFVFQITSSTATMYVLRNLKKYTWYEIRVQPFYLTVEGQESNTVRVRTLEDGKEGL